MSAVTFSGKLYAYSLRLTKYYANPAWFFGKPQFTWWTPQPTSLWTNEMDQIRAAINRDRQNGSYLNIWEIGNEPNMFPLLEPKGRRWISIFEGPVIYG